MKRFNRLVITVSLILATVSMVFAQTPDDLEDLIDVRASSGERALESRGYTLTHVSKGSDRAWGYWWNSRKRECISVETYNGRYATISKAHLVDCNQKEKSNSTRNAVIGIGAAAAVIGAIALAHKSHHHDDGRHYDDRDNEAEYERGYRDGLHSHAFHNWSNSDSYKRGYEAGVRQRKNNTSYNSGRGGYFPHTNYYDLVGSTRNNGERQLRARGFTNVANQRTGRNRYTWWYNQRTTQCIEVASSQNRINRIWATNHPNCRSNQSFNPRQRSMTWQGNVDDVVVLTVQRRRVVYDRVEGQPLRNVRYRFGSALPRRNSRVSVRKTNGRGTVRVIEQPSSRNGHRARIEIRDSRGGSDFYQFTLSW